LLTKLDEQNIYSRYADIYKMSALTVSHALIIRSTQRSC